MKLGRKIRAGMKNLQDEILSLSPEEFQKRYGLDDEDVDLMEVQRQLFKDFCQSHDCVGAEPLPSDS